MKLHLFRSLSQMPIYWAQNSRGSSDIILRSHEGSDTNNYLFNAYLEVR